MIEIIIKINGREIKWIVENPNVKSILEKLPKEKLPEYIEMYILVGDTVLSYASIQTSEKTLEKYFGEIMKNLQSKADSIGELNKKIEDEIVKNLPLIIRNTIESIIRDTIESRMIEKLSDLKTQVNSLKNIHESLPQNVKDKIEFPLSTLKTITDNLIKDFPKTIETKIETEMRKRLEEMGTHIKLLQEIQQQLPNIIKSQIGEYIGKLEQITIPLSEFTSRYKGAKGKGEIGEIVVYQSLVDNFKDDTFEDVSKQKNYSDIKAIPKDGVDILIEVKNHTNEVPSKEVQKFWNNLDSHNVNIGCFISLGTRIQSIGHYNIINNGNKVGIFINAGQFVGQNGMEDGIRLAYFIAKRFAQYYKQTEMERLEDGQLRQKINNIITEIENLRSSVEKLKSIRDDLKQIEKIANNNITLIESLYMEFINRIDKILST